MYCILVCCQNITCTVEKGVPYFWLAAMKNDEVLAHKVGNLTKPFFWACCVFYYGVWSAITWNRLQTLMKELSNISKISSGVG